MIHQISDSNHSVTPPCRLYESIFMFLLLFIKFLCHPIEHFHKYENTYDSL